MNGLTTFFFVKTETLEKVSGSELCGHSETMPKLFTAERAETAKTGCPLGKKLNKKTLRSLQSNAQNTSFSV